MNALKVKSLSVLFLLLLLIGNFSGMVKATQIETGVGVWYKGYVYWTPPYQNQMIHADTGKYIVCYWKTTAAAETIIVVKMFNSMGNLLSTVEIDTVTAANNKLSLSMGYFDSDEIFVAWSGYSGDKIKIVKVNVVNNNVGTIYGIALTNFFAKIGNYVNYEGNVYLIATVTYGYGTGTANDYLGIFKFTGSAITSFTTLVANCGEFDYVRPPKMYQDETIPNKCYVIWGYGSDGSVSSTPKYYVIDLAGAGSIQLLATAGSNSLFPTTTDNIWRIQYMSCGKYTHENNTYLYFAYGYPYLVDNIWTYSLSVSVLKFGDEISSADLVGQTVRNQIRTDPSMSAGTGYGHLWGYMPDENTLLCWYAVHDVPNDNQERAYLLMMDSKDITKTTFDTTLYSGEYFEILVHNPYDVIGKFANCPDHMLVVLDELTFYIVTGGSILEYEYDIIMDFDPDDSPLITQTSYNFEVTVYLNGVISSGEIVEIIIDGILVKTAQTNVYGKISIPSLTFATAGDKDIAVFILNNEGESLYSEEETKMVIDIVIEEPEDATAVLIPTSFSVILTFVPAMLIVFFPMVIGYKEMGFGGFIAGSILGIGIGAWAGLIPMFLVYLLALGLAIVLVMKIKGNGGGGE